MLPLESLIWREEPYKYDGDNNNNNKHIDYRLIVCYAKIAFIIIINVWWIHYYRKV